MVGCSLEGIGIAANLLNAAKTVATAGKFISNVASFAICAAQAADVGSAMEFLALGFNMAGLNFTMKV